MIVEVGRLSSQIFGGLQVHAAHQMEASLGVLYNCLLTITSKT